MGKSTINGQFSIAMLVYRRVNMNTQAVCKTWWNHTKAAEFWCTTNNHQNMGILTRTWGYYHITNQLTEDMTRRWGCKQSSGLLETHCGSMITMFGVAKLVILLYIMCIAFNDYLFHRIFHETNHRFFVYGYPYIYPIYPPNLPVVFGATLIMIEHGDIKQQSLLSRKKKAQKLASYGRMSRR